jgi:hypothetical protein
VIEVAFLKSRNGHAKSTFGIFWYLTKSKQNADRVVASDFINLSGDNITKNWYQIMNETRIANDNNRDKGGRGKARTYNHYIISPNPKDDIDIDTLRALTTQWAMEFFGDYEVAIIYHDDNRNHIPHAHVVVNNTNLVTGNRCDIPKGMPERMKQSLQDSARDLGLRYFDNKSNDKHSSLHIRDTRQQGFSALSLIPDIVEPESVHEHDGFTPKTLQNEYRTYAERHADDTGGFLWKDDIRARVDIALRLSSDTNQFITACQSLDLEVRYTKSGNDFLFIHPERDTWRCSGNRLGNSYTPGGIRRRFATDARQGKAHTISDSEKFSLYLNGFRRAQSSPIYYIRPGSDITLKDMAKTLKFIESYSIRSLQDFATIIKRFDEQPKTASLIAKMRTVAYDSGMITDKTPKTKAPWKLPTDFKNLTNRQLAQIIHDTYKAIGISSDTKRRTYKSKTNKSATDAGRRKRTPKNRTKKNRE